MGFFTSRRRTPALTGAPAPAPSSPAISPAPAPGAALTYGESAAQWLAAVRDLSQAAAYKRLSFDLLGPRPGERILELGCGLGDDARDLAARVGTDGRVTAADAEADMIERARQRHHESGRDDLPVDYVVADGGHLPFDDGTFDAVRVDRMLQHVAEPLTVLREMRRVLRPGGRTVIIEPDWACVTVYPGGLDGQDDDRVVSAVLDAFRSDVRHPLIGRQLRHLLAAAGYADVSVYPIAYASQRFDEADLVFELTASARAAQATGALTAEDAAAWLAALQAADAAGSFFASLQLMFAVGTRAGLAGEQVPPSGASRG